MDNNELITEQIVQNLSFEVQAVHQKNTTQESYSKNTPMNVKIRVRKKEEAAIEQCIISVTKGNAKNSVPEKIRLVNSDQTIMSFDVTMEADFDKKSARKHRKRIFNIFKPGICLSTQVNDDDYPYLPASSYNPNKPEDSISSKSDGILKLHFPLSKRNTEFSTSRSYSKKHKIFLGKCKPGGCLDPPFEEDSFTYSPATQTISILQQDVIKMKPAKIGNVSRISKQTVVLDSTYLNNNKLSLDNSLNFNEATKVELDKNSILNIYQADSMNTSLSTTHSNSILTYPPTLTSSDVYFNYEKNPKNRLSIPENKSKKSFNEFSDSYFIAPKKKSNQIIQKTSYKNDLDILVTKVDNQLADRFHLMDNEGNSKVPRTCNISTSFDNKGDEKTKISMLKETGKHADSINDPHITQPINVTKHCKDSKAGIDEEDKTLLLKKCSSQLLSPIGTKLSAALEPSDRFLKNYHETFQNKFEQLNITNSFEGTINGTYPNLSYQQVDTASKNSHTSVMYEKKEFDKYTQNKIKSPSKNDLQPYIGIPSLSGNSDFTRRPSMQSNLETFKDINFTREVLRQRDELKSDQQENRYEQTNFALLSSNKRPNYHRDIECKSEKIVDNKQNCVDSYLKNVDCKIPIQTKNNFINRSLEADFSLEDMKVETSFEPSFLLGNNLSSKSLKISVNSISDEYKVTQKKYLTYEATPQSPPKVGSNILLQSLEPDLDQTKYLKDVHIAKIDLEHNLSPESPVTEADPANDKVRKPHIIDSAVGKVASNLLLKSENLIVNQNLPVNFRPKKDNMDGLKSNPDILHLANKLSTESLKFKTSFLSNRDIIHIYNTESISEGLTPNASIKDENIFFHKRSGADLAIEDINKKLIVKPDIPQSDNKLSNESIYPLIVLSDTQVEEYNILLKKRSDSILSAKITSEADVNISMKQLLLTKPKIKTNFKSDNQFKSADETPSFIDNYVNREQLNNDNNNEQKLDNVAIESVSPNRTVDLSGGSLKNEETKKIDTHESLQKNLKEEKVDNLGATSKSTPQMTHSFHDAVKKLHPIQDEVYDILYKDSILSSHEPSINKNVETLIIPNSDFINTKDKTFSSQQSSEHKEISENDLKQLISSPNYAHLKCSFKNLNKQNQAKDTKDLASLVESKNDNTNRSILSSDQVNIIKDTTSNAAVCEKYNDVLKKSKSSFNLSDLLPDISVKIHRSREEEKSNTLGIKFKSGVHLPSKKTFKRSDILVTKPINLLKNTPDTKLETSLDVYDNTTSSKRNCLKPYNDPIPTKAIQRLDEIGKTHKIPINDISPKKRIIELNEAKNNKEVQVKDSIKSNKAQEITASSTEFRSFEVSTSRDTVSIDFAFQNYANGNHQRILKTYDSAKEPERYANDTLVFVKSQFKLSNEIRIPVDTEYDIFLKVKKVSEVKERVDTNKTSLDYSKSKLMAEFNEADNQELLTKIHKSEATAYNDILGNTLQGSLALIYEQELVPLQNIIKDMKEEIDVLAEQQLILRNQLYNNKKIKPTRLINEKKICGCSRKYL